jgi:tRNA(His) 5'-end guanylyltransferase
VPPGAWAVIRADGRGFSPLTEAHFTKPYDERMRQHMTIAATALMTEFGGIYGCTNSDEISVALPPQSQLFGRGLEKLVSVSIKPGVVQLPQWRPAPDATAPGPLPMWCGVARKTADQF